MSDFETNTTTTEAPAKTDVNELVYLIAPIIIIVIIILFSALVSLLKLLDLSYYMNVLNIGVLNG